ncbi:hypothetical protein [Beijerinckia mobilis]|uniref:hypothetical protein n=1 Tax=Beijerinckia mobilis TaxID=231434 RepID=UPI001AEBAC51|nr:hypothetical protein [Beijerinckia mobilis]
MDQTLHMIRQVTRKVTRKVIWQGSRDLAPTLLYNDGKPCGEVCSGDAPEKLVSR